MLTQDRLKELLHYDPETGVFTRLVRTSNRVKIGDIAGSINHHGYVQFHLESKLQLGHQLAWLYVNGVLVNTGIDHKDRNRSNNKIENLRLATKKQNSENSGTRIDNTSGFRGVCFKPKTGKWAAQIQHNGKNVHLGIFSTAEEASEACRVARDSLFTHHN